MLEFRLKTATASLPPVEISITGGTRQHEEISSLLTSRQSVKKPAQTRKNNARGFVKPVQWPDGFSIEQLNKNHKRSSFYSGVEMVDEWLKKNARQAQKKQFSVTRILLKKTNIITGYYTIAMGQVNFNELPHEMARKLPGTLLPIVTLAWLGIDKHYQGKEFGERLLAQALADCHQTGQIMPFVAVLLDCATVSAKTFYQRYDFEELPGHPMKLMLPWKLLNRMMG